MTTFNAKFETYQGSDITINFTIVDADGHTPIDISSWALAANFSLVATGDTDEDLALSVGNGITITDGGEGEGKIVLSAAVSTDMTIGEWEYDLWRTDAGETYPVALGAFTLAATPRSRNTDVS